MRFSLTTLLCVVAVVALACSSLLYPNPYWRLAASAMVAAALSWASVMAVVKRSERRVIWGSFAVIGWFCLALAGADKSPPGAVLHEPLIRWTFERMHPPLMVWEVRFGDGRVKNATSDVEAFHQFLNAQERLPERVHFVEQVRASESEFRKTGRVWWSLLMALGGSLAGVLAVLVTTQLGVGSRAKASNAG